MVACTWAPREALGGGKGDRLGGGWQLDSGGWRGGYGRLEAAGAAGEASGQQTRSLGGGDTREIKTDEKTQPSVELGAIY